MILTISGKLENTNSEHGAQFDLNMLLALQQTVINTNTPWTKGMTKFEGPTLKELLKHVGAIPEEVMATALNGYRIKLPIVDINNYPMIIALKRDDEVLSVRTKGPIWVIYPWSENPEIRDNLYYTRSIWQLQQLDIN
ncbi:MAG: hypothetical protein HRU06_00370 [Oceanospirillaceae bacterium]|nr:hypothetical protein [Oceanospirillaceae bacterium]